MFKSKGKKSKVEAKPPILKFEEKVALELFNTLADPDDNEIIQIEGIANLCETLQIDPSIDIRGLVLMWKLGALSKPGAITKTEFLQGMKNLGQSDINGLTALLPSFDPGFLEKSEFRGFLYFNFILRF
jgi:hypothetical protein